MDIQRGTAGDRYACIESTLPAIAHVCLGSGWDGGGGPVDFQEISALPEVTEGLKQAGNWDNEIEMVWSGNILRILKDAESYPKQ